MKGFVLKMDDKIFSGGLDDGIVDVLVSNKEFGYKLKFGGLDNNNVSYTWHNVELQLGDRFAICYETIKNATPATTIKNCNIGNVSTDEEDRKSLNLYYQLKKELIQEGLIAP